MNEDVRALKDALKKCKPGKSISRRILSGIDTDGSQSAERKT